MELSESMETLKTDIKELAATTKEMERNSETEVLSDLKGIQNKMKVCKTQLEALVEWDQICSSCEDAVSSENIEVTPSSPLDV